MPARLRSSNVRPYVIGTLGFLLLLSLGEIGSRFIVHRLSPDPSVTETLGQVTESKGKVYRVRAGRPTAREEASAEPLGFGDGDQLETAANASATLTLSTQDELTVAPDTTLLFELWNERDPASPIYLHVLAGDVSSRRAGVRGRLYVVRNGRLYFPNQKPGAKEPLLLVPRATTQELTSKTSNDAETATTPTPEASVEAGLAARSDDPVTLSNEYVEGVISSRSSQFQKCWMSRLKDHSDLKGKLTVQFEITKRGRVRDAAVVDSSFNDPALASCVTSVIERLPFRPFRGPDIAIAYPISFE